MKIELKQITIRDITHDYVDSQEEGILGYAGNLNIRPKYQREFVYDEKKRNAVIDTITKGFPLNVMYWVKSGQDTYELMDGQQRTVSFCQYINNEFSVNDRAFHNLTQPEKDKILDYECMVYICEGKEDEKLAWFKIINIAGEKLTNQEMRNAMYTGTWLTDAKKHFSKTGCAAYSLASKYVSGSPIRQDYLEKVIEWKIDEEKLSTIEKYMSIHQQDYNANELWYYFLAVIEWVKGTFIKYRSDMKGINWGILYNKFHKKVYDSNLLEENIKKLRLDDEVSNKKGIYEYILSGNEKTLNLRTFSEAQKIEMYEKQDGICVHCKKHFEFEHMEGDHIKPWHLGGKTETSNGQMLCIDCNRTKSGK